MRHLKILVSLCVFWASSSALADRNGAGTYSLPAGNPVVSGTPISSTWANNLANDIAINLTSSLDRSGRGAMLAQLQLYAGTLSFPGLTFALETNSGLYRIGSKDFGWAFNGVKGIEWNNGAETITALATNTAAITATGNGTSPGVSGTGGATSGDGILGTGGASNGVGVHGVGTGTGNGVNGLGGATSGVGVFGGGGGGNAAGVSGAGALGGTGPGGTFANGTAATASTYQDAIIASNGALDMHSVANPNSGVGFLNRLVPASIVKAYGTITTPGSNSTSCTISATTGAPGSLNLASCAAVSGGGTGFASRSLQAILTTGLSTAGSQLAGSVVLASGLEGGVNAVNSVAMNASMINGTTVGFIGYKAQTTAAMDCYANACSVSFVVYGVQ